jgi:hypothetical protein
MAVSQGLDILPLPRNTKERGEKQEGCGYFERTPFNFTFRLLTPNF